MNIASSAHIVASPLGGVSCLDEEELAGAVPSEHQQQPPWMTRKEVQIQCALAGPLILGNLLNFSLRLVSSSFVGHTGVLELSGAALANSFTLVTGYSVLHTSLNELGAGNPQAVRGAVNVARILGMLEASIIVAVLLLARNVWGRLYSGDKEVVTAIAGFIPFVAVSSAFDALQTVSGVIRGAGWQQVAAYVNLGSFYFAGVPTGCLLAFIAHLEGKGLWMGLIVGTTMQFMAYTLLVWLIDWTEEAKMAAVRVGASLSPLQPLELDRFASH